MIKISFYYTLFITLFFCLISCSSAPTPEQQIEGYISDIVKSCQNRDLKGLKKLISDNYIDTRHNNRKAILQIAASHFIRNKSINILTKIESLNFSNSGTTANLTVYAALSKLAIQEGDLDLLHAKIHRFEIILQKESKKWLLSSAEWQRATIDDFL